MPAIDPATLTRFYTQHLSWSSCGGGFECGTLQVPLDYANPSAATVSLAVVRHRVANPIGSVVVNPGGPGASGVQFVKSAWSRYADQTQNKFNVVSFDPRGTGESEPIRCVAPRVEDEFVSYDADPKNTAQVTHIGQLDAEFARGCKEKSGAILAHVGTVETARDLDVLRAALGDDKLTYVGESYGTFLGAIYAQLFPTHIRAMVLDGALDPSLDDQKEADGQAKGFETALRSFISSCVKDPGCPLGTSASAAEPKLDAWLEKLTTAPLSASGRVLTRTLAVTGVAAALYNPGSWLRLTSALRTAMGGDPRALLALADSLNGRRPDGSYANLLEANVAINCADRGAAASSIGAAAAAAAAEEVRAPTFGDLIGWGNPVCVSWPVPIELAPGPVRADGAPPIVVIGTLRDPATPFAWAQALARQLSSGVLVSFDGDGHTADLRGSPCIDGIVRDYLVSLQAPTDGTACGPRS